MAAYTQPMKRFVTTAIFLCVGFAYGEVLERDLFQPLYQHGELRDCYVVSEAGEYSIVLDGISDSAVVLVSAYAEAAISMQLVLGENTIATRRASAGSEWVEWRFDIPRDTHGEGSFRVEFSCAGEAILGLPTVQAADRGATPVLVYLIDTLRSDRLGCYGGSRGLTPNMDALAQDGIRATRMVPASSWTRPSVASLLSGMYPPAHGAEGAMDHIRSDIPSLAGELRKQGYRTVGFMSNPNGLPEWGFGAGFDRYMNAYAHEWEIPTDRKVVDQAIQTSRYLSDVPWFIYAHVMGPHNPYSPEKWFSLQYRQLWYSGTAEEKRTAREIDAYDAEVAYADYHFGRLVSELKREGLYDRALIILTSDHGEELWEHGINGHGESVRETLLRIPLIVKLPEGLGAGRVVDDVITHADLAPTILDALKVAVPTVMQGESRFTDMLDDEAGATPEFTILTRNDYTLATTQVNGVKYVRDLVSGDVQWIDLVADPEERAPSDTSPTTDYDLATLTEIRAAMDRPGFYVTLPRDAVDVSIALDAEYETESFGLGSGAVSWDAFTIRIVAAEAEAQSMRGLYIAAPMDARFSVSSLGVMSVLHDETTLTYESDKTLIVQEIASAPGVVRWDELSQDRFHIWAITTPPARAEGDEMSDEMREALEGLGYL